MSITLIIFLCILLVLRTCRSEPLAGWSEPANPNEFPFVVSIAQRFDITPDNPYGHVCGGALITRKYVLTAASCFTANRKESDYFVYVGSNDLASSAKIEIDLLTTYECWLKKTTRCFTRTIFYDNDIAVIKLSKQVMSPARSAKISNLSPMDLEGEDAISAGWGLTFNDTVPRYMLKADLRVINERQCLQNVRNAANDPTYYHQPNFFCTNGITLFAVLDEGDRGSPVFVKHGSGDYRIIGVNQKAAPMANDVVQIPDQQNKHVNVHYYCNFIQRVTYIRSLKC